MTYETHDNEALVQNSEPMHFQDEDTYLVGYNQQYWEYNRDKQKHGFNGIYRGYHAIFGDIVGQDGEIMGYPLVN